MSENVTLREVVAAFAEPAEAAYAEPAEAALAGSAEATAQGDPGERAGQATSEQPPTASRPDTEAAPTDAVHEARSTIAMDTQGATANQMAQARETGAPVPVRPASGRPSTADLVAAPTPPTPERPVGNGSSQPAAPAAESRAPLFGNEQATSFRGRWQDVQTAFVDEPRHAVEEADALVAEVMQQLAATFADERRLLEQHWSQGDKVSTEDLRIAFRRYRSFFDRLLAL